MPELRCTHNTWSFTNRRCRRCGAPEPGWSPEVEGAQSYNIDNGESSPPPGDNSPSRPLPSQQSAQQVVYIPVPAPQPAQVESERSKGGIWAWITILASVIIGFFGVSFLGSEDTASALFLIFYAAVGFIGAILKWINGAVWGRRIFWILILAMPCIIMALVHFSY